LRTVRCPHPEIEQALLLNEIEIGLTMRPVSHPNLLLTPLRSCSLCAIAPPAGGLKNC